jgi:hypothetical protein
MRSFDKKDIKLLNRAIIEDEFDDKLQNTNIYDDQVSGFDILHTLEYTYDSKANADVLNVGAGSSADISPGFSQPPVNVFNLEPNPKRGDSNDNVITGWCENIDTDKQFDFIVCWGTFCFTWSTQLTLLQFNRRLITGGRLIMDIVSESIFPLAQTQHPDSFVRHVSLFGFELEHRIPFGTSTHKREGFRFKKVRDFDINYFKMPQATGKINNYLPERDWPLA